MFENRYPAICYICRKIVAPKEGLVVRAKATFKGRVFNNYIFKTAHKECCAATLHERTVGWTFK